MQEQLGTYKEAINDALQQYFTDLPRQLDMDLSEHGQDALKKIEEYSLRPGKRIRGALACFAYDYVSNQTNGKSGVQAAVALELVQNYLLIVDDVMDHSVMRRGKPTIHELYLKEQNHEPKDIHLAHMLAINVGLITQHLVNIVLAQVDEDPSRVQQAILLLHKNIMATGFGQIEDTCQHKGVKVSEQDIFRKYTLKSGYYTFVCPLQLGVVLAGKDNPEILQEITDFGLAAGIAFQLKDDLLGIFASIKTTGKPNTDDLEEGKYTLLMQYALQHASEEKGQMLANLLGKQHISEVEVQQAQSILEESGAKAYVETKIEEYAAQAKKMIQASTFWSKAAKDTLAGIVTYSIERQR